MKKDQFRALFSKFQVLSKLYAKREPPATKAEKRSAWSELVNEFIRVEMSDPLEIPNLFMRMPNPYAKVKLDVFKGESLAVPCFCKEKCVKNEKR
jgi:hypothetical protein